MVLSKNKNGMCGGKEEARLNKTKRRGEKKDGETRRKHKGLVSNTRDHRPSGGTLPGRYDLKSVNHYGDTIWNNHDPGNTNEAQHCSLNQEGTRNEFRPKLGDDIVYIKLPGVSHDARVLTHPDGIHERGGISKGALDLTKVSDNVGTIAKKNAGVQNRKARKKLT